MVNDSHIHIGQFERFYTSPREVICFLDKVGVKNFTVSSTTIWEEDYNHVLDELYTLCNLGGNRVYPVLWITPKMIENSSVEMFLDSSIKWSCVKIHGFHFWNKSQIEQAIVIAQQLSVPMLIHTGGKKECEAGMYEKYCKENPSQTFILAHSRPCDQTISLMKRYKNVWADTAYTSEGDVFEMVQHHGLYDRILWGTDYPIQKVYGPCPKNISLYYKRRLCRFREMFSDEVFTKITYNNFFKCFVSSRT